MRQPRENHKQTKLINKENNQQPKERSNQPRKKSNNEIASTDQIYNRTMTEQTIIPYPNKQLHHQETRLHMHDA
jgi:hypothetical protein